MSKIVNYLLFLYQKIGLLLFGYRCRYYPSCSHYTGEAVEHFGLLFGVFLALKRIIRCNQFFPGGFDPVPVKNVPRETFQNEAGWEACD